MMLSDDPTTQNVICCADFLLFFGSVHHHIEKKKKVRTNKHQCVVDNLPHKHHPVILAFTLCLREQAEPKNVEQRDQQMDELVETEREIPHIACKLWREEMRHRKSEMT